MSPLPQRMANRWARREMLPPGKGRLYWHVLFHGRPEVSALVHEAHTRLAGIPNLDLTPQAFIHLTVLIAGYSHEIAEDQVTAMANEAAVLLAQTPPMTVTVGRALYHPEAIALEVQPADRLLPILHAARTATRTSTGRDGVLAHDAWMPHITIAYSTADGPAAPVIEALGRGLPSREITISSVSLVVQDGPENTWDWRPVAEVRLGTALGSLVQE